MAKRWDPLPVFGGLVDPLKRIPSLDEARAQLGGPWIGGPDIGAVVTVSATVGERAGVVVHATPTERDVTDEGKILAVSFRRINPVVTEHASGA